MADGGFSAFAWHRYVLSEHCALDPYEGLVMLALVRFADERGRAFPGMGTLAKVTRVSRTKVVHSLAALETLGLFKRQAQTRGKGLGSNTYQLPLEPPCSAPQTLPGQQTSAPHALGSAPETLGVVRPTHQGSAPGAPYLPNELSIGTTQGTGEAPAAPSQPTSRPLVLEMLESPRKRSEHPKKRAQRSRKAPETWSPEAACRALAAERGKNFDEELAKFRDHEFASAKSDWDGTFRNWLRNERFGAGARVGGIQRGVPNVAEANGWGRKSSLLAVSPRQPDAGTNPIAQAREVK